MGSEAPRFATEYATHRRRKRVYASLFGAAFLACIVAAGVTAKFDILTLVQGLPRTTEFLVKLVPPIGMASSGMPWLFTQTMPDLISAATRCARDNSRVQMLAAKP